MDGCEQFPELRAYHQREFLTEVRLLVEQELRGMYVDQEKMQRYHDVLVVRIAAKMEEFLTHPDVAPHVAKFNEAAVAAVVVKEPPKQIQSGAVSKRWEQWVVRVEKAKVTNFFNPNSKDQLAWLFYDCLGNEVRKLTESGKRSIDKETLPWMGEPGTLLVAYNKMVKELGYVKAYLENIRGGLIHIHCKIPGTVTGRLAGGEEDE